MTKLTNNAITQIRRILRQSVCVTAETPYQSELFENWKFGNQKFNATAELDGGFEIEVVRTGSDNGNEYTYCKLKTPEDKYFEFSVSKEEGFNCSQWLSDEKVEKIDQSSEDFIIALAKDVFNVDVSHIHAYNYHHYRNESAFETIFEVCSSEKEPIDIPSITYIIDGNAYIKTKTRNQTKV